MRKRRYKSRSKEKESLTIIYSSAIFSWIGILGGGWFSYLKSYSVWGWIGTIYTGMVLGLICGFLVGKIINTLNNKH